MNSSSLLDAQRADERLRLPAADRAAVPAGRRERRSFPGCRRSSPSYCIRAALVDWLASHAATVREGDSVVDVGCGDRRHEPLFTRSGASYAGFDGPWNPAADVAGDASALPIPDAAYDVVVCTQVLEHLPRPAAAVAELRRIVRPGGRVLVSTHGTSVFHPCPLDLWRWTAPGLEMLFLDSADWSSVTVAPAQGTAATTAMLLANFADLAFKRMHIRRLGAPLVFCLNLAGEALDSALPLLRQPIPGSLTATFHVDARP